jgi:N-acetyltransferase 10
MSQIGTTVPEELGVVLENGVRNHHRSLIVMVGPNGHYQVPAIHEALCGRRSSTPPSLLWCYRHELQFSSRQEKRTRESQRPQTKVALDQDTADPFQLFMNSNTIRSSKYRDTSSILGQTFGMLVLQDFHDITPNALARTIETISGGGTVLLLLDTLKDIEDLHTISMSFQKRMRTDAFGPLSNRFNGRFLSSLKSCQNFIAVDSQFNLLPQFTPTSSITSFRLENAELQRIKDQNSDTEYLGLILEHVVTLDQANTVVHLCDVLGSMEIGKVVGLTAARGRGKSAALGFSVAFAIAKGYVNVFVSSPSPSNVATLFEFLIKGFDALGFRAHADYDVVQNEQKEVTRINVHIHGRQTISYVSPADSQTLGHCDLLVIDEAAAIPLPIVRKLIGPYTVLLSSTVNGYEGTGRSLSLKLFAEFRKNGDDKFSEVVMSSPIRYAANDPIEEWLCQLLCLNAEPIKPAVLPPPAQCELVSVNRDVLFSGESTSESFLTSLVGLSVASHYKNEPDDLILMSDAPNHRIFALVPPTKPGETVSTPICYLQVALEGHISRETADEVVNRGHRPEGDLIPWTLRTQFDDGEMTTRTGIRIVRVSVHPEMQKRGYGSCAIKQLLNFYGSPVDPEQITADQPLLKRLTTCDHERVDYAGVSFGLTEALFHFWRMQEFKPVYISQATNSATGEHSAIVLRGFGGSVEWIDRFAGEFRLRFGRLLGFQFRDYPGKLCAEIFAAVDPQARQTVDPGILFTEDDARRLFGFSHHRTDFPIILDLIPKMCEFFFERNADVRFTRLMQTILIVLGFQHRTVDEYAEGFGVPVNQVIPHLQKMAGIFAEYCGYGTDGRQFSAKSAAIPA